MWEEYNYRYVNLVTPAGQHTAWRRIPEERIHEWLTDNQGALSYFQTIQSFRGAEKSDGEPHWTPLFFDMDAPDELPDEERLDKAYSDTRLLIDYFLQGFYSEPQIWFTGGRGFHILVAGELFDARPDGTLTYHWKHLASRIKTKLGLDTLDLRVYSIPRMWRLSNTKHVSGRYKIPITIVEFNRGLQFILDHARSPRSISVEDEAAEVNVGLSQLYKEVKDEYHDRIKVYTAAPDFAVPQFGEEPPPCIRFLFENGLALLGTKNQADMVIANYCKASNLPIESATQVIAEWAKAIPISLTHVDNPDARVLQSLRVLRNVYSDPKYKFSCGSARACGFEPDCNNCKVRIESLPRDISIAEYALAENFAHRVRMEADVVGKDIHELIVPSEITAWCRYNPESARCGDCQMGNYFNEEAKRMQRKIVFDANEPLTLSLIDVTKSALHHRVRQLFNAHSRCYEFKYEVSWANANVLYLASRVSGDFRLEKEITRMRAIYLGHEVELNQGYILEGVVWSHPHNQRAILIVDKMDLIQSSLSTFALSEGELEELSIFRPAANQSAMDKIEEIHDVFMRDFLRNFGREDMLLAYDLVFHSVRRFNFQREENVKGWLDILCIGDSAQAKTTMIQKLMEYYNLGIIASGESSTRTGLLYAIHMVAGEEAWIQYGLMCRANGYIMAVDEVHEMSPKDFGRFTKARSEGKVEVHQIAWGAARAETRMISICNSRPGKGLGSFAFPVQAIPDLPCFEAREDIRRWDYAVGAMTGEVDTDVINQDQRKIIVPEHPYNPQKCRNLVLWIWTRPPDKIIIERDAELAILEYAKEMGMEYVPDIPLVEAADVRYKIARTAIAVAGRVFSSPDGDKLVVKKEHVEVAHQVIERFYKSEALRYWDWSDDRKAVFHDDETLDNLVMDFKIQFATEWDSISRWVLEMADFTKGLLKTSTGMATRDVDQLMAHLAQHRFITTESGRYVKTPTGRLFFQKMLGKAPVTKEIPEKEDEF